ncbi:MAG: hypothetical protein ACYSR8_09665 [Planctomycetota bacterium]|jgi:hypothetical protein
MCEYITAILPKDINIDELQHIITKHKRKFNPLINEHIMRQLNPGEQYFTTSSAMCDCGTPLGRFAPTSEDGRDLDLRLKRKLRILQKKGWSKTKIDRWVEQHKMNEEKEARDEKHRKELYITAAQDWKDFLIEMVSSKTSYIGILKHWYNRNIETEHIEIKKRIRIRAGDVSVDDLLRIEEDILYEFTK